MDKRFTPQPENIPPALQGIPDLAAPRKFFCDDCKDNTRPAGLIVPDISPLGNPRFNEEGQLAVRFDCAACGRRQNDRVQPWGELLTFLVYTAFASLLGLGCKFFLTGWWEIREHVGYGHGEFLLGVFLGAFGVLFLALFIIGIFRVPATFIRAWKHRHRPGALRKQLQEAGWLMAAPLR